MNLHLYLWDGERYQPCEIGSVRIISTFAGAVFSDEKLVGKIDKVNLLDGRVLVYATPVGAPKHLPTRREQAA